MNTNNVHQSMTHKDRRAFKRGAQLVGELQGRKSFDDYWLPIGQGLQLLRRRADAASERKGDCNAAYGRLIAATPYAKLHRVPRSNLLFCMRHLPDIAIMRASWSPTERTRINHPDTIAKRLRDYLMQR